MRVRWTAPSLRDFTHICDYIKEHDGPARARRIALGIYEHIEGLIEFPRRGRPGRKPDTRELLISGVPYVAVYRVRGEEVEVLRLLHGAQKWP